MDVLDKNILNYYRFGSIVYGTNNELSDEDFVMVTEDKVDRNDINIHSYTRIEFQRLLDNHDIQILECFFLDDKFKLKEDYNINDWDFRFLIIDESLKNVSRKD